jgi:hypothetical protein
MTSAPTIKRLYRLSYDEKIVQARRKKHKRQPYGNQSTGLGIGKVARNRECAVTL